MWQAIALSLGLAMDATAVSAARGLADRDRREMVILAALFGLFQSGMAALGWLGGRWARALIGHWDTWIAAGLLVAIGGKMIRDAWREAETGEHKPGSLGLYIALAVATSIDAAVAGLTLTKVRVAPGIALALIGGVTAACSALGYEAGTLIGRRFGAKLGIFGGVALIAIAVDIVIKGL